MSTGLKALVVVLALALLTFSLARRYCLEFVDPADYDRRRNVWLALTALAFLSPSFWVWCFIAAPLMVWCAARDASPPSLYLLLMHVIPPVSFFIPVSAVNQLFDLNNYRLAALVILLPFLLRQARQEGSRSALASLAIASMLGFGLLKIVLNLPHESATASMRRAFLFTIDVFLTFVAFTRAASNARDMRAILCTFCLSCAIMAPISLFEALRGWLLYESVPYDWGNPLPFSYLLRGDALRAQVSAGHSLPLGYMMAIAFGLALYLTRYLGERRHRLIVIAWFAMGLYGPMSRAPWLTAVASAVVFFLFQPKGLGRIAKGSLAAAAVFGVLLLTPLGERLINFLPFVGNVDADNVVYRQKLADLSWQLIQLNPLFGDPFVLNNMEEMRQGQGIIDLVNVYAEVTLFNGVVGLVLFLTPFLSGIWLCLARAAREGSECGSLRGLGVALGAAMIATLLMMATGSFGTGLAQMFWILGGLSLNYARLNDRRLDTLAHWQFAAGGLPGEKANAR